MSQTKRYLGDSVYVDFNGYSLILTTNNGYDDSNEIMLEPEVYYALTNYVAHIMAASLKKPSERDE